MWYAHHGSRHRYLNREIYAPGLLWVPHVLWPVNETWSDYDRDDIHGDFTADDVLEETTPLLSFEPGIGRGAYDELGTPVTEYYHADMLGSTRMMTDSAGNGFDEAAYSAFGQLQFAGTAHRYGYAGAWGYQAPSSDSPSDPYLAFPFLHVGARYYDPATGRFLQRDPIGIRAGLNVYEYVTSTPTGRVDPDGTYPLGGFPVENPPPPPGPGNGGGGGGGSGGAGGAGAGGAPAESAMSCAEELEQIKKQVVYVDFGLALSGAVLGAMVGGPVGGVIGAIVGAGGGHMIDETVHFDEPVNPVIGGSYGAGG